MDPFGVEDNEVDSGRQLARSWAASIRSGLRDIGRHRGLVLMIAATVSVGSVLTLLGPLLDEAVDAGDEYVTMNSELIVLADSSTPIDIAELADAVSSVDGVQLVRPSTTQDLEALPPNQIFRFTSGETLVIEPTGRVRVEAIRQEALDIRGVSDVALGVGVPSQMTIALVRALLPWVAIAFFVSALILIANLSFLLARTRRAEAEAMRLVGGTTLSIVIRTGLVVAVPTVLSIVATTTVVALTASSIVSAFLPSGVALNHVAQQTVSTGIVLAMAATVVVGLATVASIGRVATK